MKDKTPLATFVKARYAELKARPELSYSFRAFSRLAGFGSPNYLKLIMDGDRMISVPSIPKFCRGLMLSPEQSEAFTVLALSEISKKNPAVKAFLAATKQSEQPTEENV